MTGNVPPPPPGYTLQTSSAVPPPPAGFVLQNTKPQAEAPEGAQNQNFASQKPEAGIFERMWNGLTGRDATKAGGFGMGIGDPALGAAQLAVHIGAVDPEAAAFVPPDIGKQASPIIDKAVQEREQSYQTGRKSGGRLGMDWMRLAGNIASPVNALIGAGTGGLGAEAGIAGRIGAAAGGGALGGAVEPVTGPGDFTKEKAIQSGMGAVGGAAVGAAAEPLARAIAGRDPAALERFIQSNYSRAVKPPLGSKATASQVDVGQSKIRSAIDSIIENKDALHYQTSGGPAKGRLPQTLEEFTDAIEQTRDALFRKYDAMSQAAEDADTGTTTTVTKFHDQFARTARRAASAQVEIAQAERQVTQAAAKQARAGDNVYLSASANQSRREAEARLMQAKTDLERATAAKDAAKKNLSGAWIDLDPIVGELQRLSSSTLADTHPGIAAHVNELQARLMRRGAYSPSEAQEVIQRYNSSLKAFYKNPSYENALTASVDAMVANRLRQSLDDMIEKSVAPGYQGLKNQYGALKSIEQNVVRAAEREANKSAGGGTLAAFGDIMSAEQILRGIITLNPRAAATGALLKAAQSAMQRVRSPNAAINRLFKVAEQAKKAPQPRISRSVAGLTRSLPPVAAGATAGDVIRYNWPQ